MLFLGEANEMYCFILFRSFVLIVHQCIFSVINFVLKKNIVAVLSRFSRNPDE